MNNSVRIINYNALDYPYVYLYFCDSAFTERMIDLASFNGWNTI